LVVFFVFAEAGFFDLEFPEFVNDEEKRRDSAYKRDKISDYYNSRRQNAIDVDQMGKYLEKTELWHKTDKFWEGNLKDFFEHVFLSAHNLRLSFTEIIKNSPNDDCWAKLSKIFLSENSSKITKRTDKVWRESHPDPYSKVNYELLWDNMKKEFNFPDVNKYEVNIKDYIYLTMVESKIRSDDYSHDHHEKQVSLEQFNFFFNLFGTTICEENGIIELLDGLWSQGWYWENQDNNTDQALITTRGEYLKKGKKDTTTKSFYLIRNGVGKKNNFTLEVLLAAADQPNFISKVYLPTLKDVQKYIAYLESKDSKGLFNHKDGFIPVIRGSSNFDGCLSQDMKDKKKKEKDREDAKKENKKDKDKGKGKDKDKGKSKHKTKDKK